MSDLPRYEIRDIALAPEGHHKIDWAGIRFPLAKTPSDFRACLNSAAEIINRVF